MKYRIDRITPFMAKANIQRFNTGGLVTEDATELDELIDEINAMLRMDIPQETKKDLENQLASLQSKKPAIVDSEVMNEEDVNNSYSLAVLGNGKFFEINNSKLIGTIKHDTDRYGKAIQVLQGDISDLEQIHIPDNFAQFVKVQDYSVSSRKPSLKEQAEDPENESFINEVIEKSKKTVTRKKEQPKVEIDKAKIQTTEEIYKKLNPKISPDELKAYLWYKDDVGQTLSDEWYKIAGLSKYTKFDEKTLVKWVKDGILFYFKGKLLPKPLYLSGDMYEKISRIVKAGANSGQDINYIVDSYGQETLNRQLEECNRIYEQVYSSRLIITGNKDDNSLILKPIDKIAKTYMVSELTDYETMSWYGVKPRWEKRTGSRKTIYDELSLVDAFCFYLVTEGLKLDIKGGVTYLDIIQLYIMNKSRKAPSGLSDADKAKWKVMYKRSKAKAREEGDRLFLKFLKEQLTIDDKLTLETMWNRDFNNYIAPDYEKIPVAFNVTREFFGEDPFIIKPEKREAVSFILNEGSGCLAYDVGVGKTMCAIMIAEQFIVAGYCSRPVVVVPAQTYKQWISEIQNVLPHRKVNDYMNLRKKYLKQASTVNDQGEEVAIEVDPGSITVLTYEGFEVLNFTPETRGELMGELYDILAQQDLDFDNKKRVGSFRERLEGIMGKGLEGSFLNIEDFGFDFMCFDEAHALKKIFTNVNAEINEKGTRASKKQYQFSAGSPSKIGLKGFMVAHYILKNNDYRNVLMLTATPFTNSPLEIFSMLSLVAYHKLKNQNLNNINDFFSNYIDTTTELTINHKYQPQYKQIVKGFNNLPSLQKVISRFFNYKTGEDVGVVRPNKYVLPYVKKLVDNQIITLPSNEQVLSYLTPNPIQDQYMGMIIAYAEEKLNESDLILEPLDAGEEDETKDVEKTDETPTETVEIKNLDSESRQKARAVISMNLMRATALSPYMFPYHNLGKPTYKEFVEQSPKILYAVRCIETVKKYHEEHDQAVSGQVIYMDRGIEYFPMIKQYLVNEIGFEDHEVGFINGSMKIEDRKKVQDSFLGRMYDEKKGDFVKISDAERVKVLIGSSSIKEGMNLQKKSSVLYNLFIDWNPTDNLQLAGRVWRQGNEFKNVRIVNPLMIDSSDVFMFQKLEEKTARINTIWSNDGRSALRLDEFDPEELKNSLIKDPHVLAKINIEADKLKVADDIQFNKQLLDRLDEYVGAKNRIEDNQQFLASEYMRFYQDPDKMPEDPLKLLAEIRRLNTAKNIKTKDGKLLKYGHERRNMSWQDEEEENIAHNDRPVTNSWRVKPLYIDLRLINKELRDLLVPRGIEDNSEGIRKAKDKIDEDIARLEDEKKILESKEYVDTLAQDIIRDRLEKKIEEKTLDQAVEDFEKLNYLLNFKYCNISGFTPKKDFKELVEEGLRDLRALVDIVDGELKANILQGIEDLEEIQKFG
jgi:hypothetical protein